MPKQNNGSGGAQAHDNHMTAGLCLSANAVGRARQGRDSRFRGNDGMLCIGASDASAYGCSPLITARRRAL